MKKVKKLSLTDLVLYGLVFMVPIAPVSLYGVVYNLSHGMVALVYIIGAIAMFFTRTATLPYRSISPRRVRPMRMLAYALIPP
ncbi:amino acid permease [Salmonella enterica subsp. enterica serovar Thompson]|nr:amino acid permease [Salmonella enterica subsp. enterica serovar Thompson]